MKNLLSHALPICFGISLILGSCARDNSVASNHRIQKRKYNNGYHIAFNKKKKSTQDEHKLEKNETTFATLQRTEKNIEIVESHGVIKSLNENVIPNQELTTHSASSTIIVNHFESPVNQTSKVNRGSVRTINQSKTPSSLGVNSNEKSTSSIHSVIKKKVKNSIKQSTSGDIDPIVYILLCIFIPFVAVGLATDWEVKDVLINLLLCCLCGIPGIIHAFIVCDREGVI